MRKRTDGPVLGAQTHGETHRQNDTSLAVRPKDTNPYPWRDPCRGGGASRRLHKGGAAAFGGRPALWIPLYGSLHGYGFVSLGRQASDVSFCLWVSPWVRALGTEASVVLPMGVPMGLSLLPSNSHLALY